MRQFILSTALALLVTGVTAAQVTEIPVGSRNPTGVTLDLETASGAPAAGPISGTEPYWAVNGIVQVSILNQPGVWTPGDTLNSPSTGLTNCLGSVNNTLSIVPPQGAMDNPSPGAGFGFQFAGICTQFGFEVLDQAGAGITIEAYLGGSLQGSLTTTAPSIPTTLTFDLLPGCDELRVLATGTAGWVMDNIFLVTSGSTLTPEYQQNGSLLALTVDGAQGNEFFPFVTSRDLFLACGPASTTVDIGMSTDTAGTLYDIALSSAPLVPVSGGGIQLPSLRINLDISQPFFFLQSGTPGPLFVPMPGGPLPGISGSAWTATVGFNAPGTLSLQGIGVDATAPTGLVATNGAQIDTVSQAVPTTLAGPTATTTNVQYDLVSTPTCWTTSGVPFYGTLFNDLFVSPNGFVAFGAGGDTDTTPSVTDALNDDGRVGFWTDLDPSEGGTIDLVYLGTDNFRVDFNGVFYNTGGPACTFSIIFDAALGSITIDGLQGIPANGGTSTTDDQWLGISPGIGVPGVTATDPGATAFWSLGGGGVTNPGDMLYEFNDTSVSGSGLPASISSGLNTLVFVPDGLGNYTFAAF